MSFLNDDDGCIEELIELEVIVIIIYVFLIIVIIFGNFFVIRVFYKFLSLWSVFNVILVSLLVVDILMMVFFILNFVNIIVD